MSFATDFPSANWMMADRIHRALLIQADTDLPQPDLSHTLRRWQEAGLIIESRALDSQAAPKSIRIERPSWFSSAWYRLFALLGLERNQLGGFGGYPRQAGG